MNSIHQPIENFYFRSSVVLSELEFLHAHAEIHKFKKGQVLFFEGEAPKGVHIVKEGRLKKYIKGSADKEHIFYICSKDDVLGYHALLSNDTYYNSVSAIEDSVISFIPKAKFLELVDRSSQLSQSLLNNFGKEFGVLINRMTALAQKSVRERVALCLLILNDKFSDNAIDGEAHILLSRNDLANIVGTAKETLVRLLHDFREEGLIRTEDKSIVVLDKKTLLRVADLQIKSK